MFPTRTSRFKVETSWQELVNRRIQKITIDLKEITLANRSGFLLAKGAFRREITYAEFDGRLRRVEDRVQFEVVVGEELPEPLPLLKTELRQDYYIFQPRQIGDNQAILEQGFSLTVQEVEVDDAPEHIETIIADCIVEQGESSRLVQLAVEIDESSVQYHDFHGTIRFEPVNQNLLSGKVEGVLEYITESHQLKTQVVAGQVSWLWENSVEGKNLEYMVTGSVVGNPALVKLDNCWQLELRVDYRWMLLKKEDLPCVIPSHAATELPSPEHKIKAEVLLDHQEIRLPKSYDLPVEEMIPSEVNVSVIERNDRFGKKGLLLESLLRIEVYGRSPDGLEIYRHWEVGSAELCEGYESFQRREGVRLDTGLQLQEIHFERTAGGLRVNLILNYEIKLYHSKVIDSMEDPKNGRLVLIPELADFKSFSLMKETKVHLRRKPLQISSVQGELIHLNPSVKQGWFHISGDLELTVSYHHISGKSYQEIFSVPVSESFLWDPKGEGDWEIEIKPAIEYDTYHLETMNIIYKFLLHLDVGFYQKRELKIKALPPAAGRPPQSIDSAKRPDALCCDAADELYLVMEKEVPLVFGIAREISQKRASIVKFDYKDALNAILAEGVLETDLEYWDENGFLRQERLNTPFWKFIPYSSRSVPDLSRLRLFPEIQRTTVIPVNAWPWHKGMVKITVELVLKHSKGGGC